MALSVFGIGVDVHVGGADLRYPHHAYHAAMAEANTGTTPYARAWFQVGTVTVDGAKMAKSAGNLVLLEELLGKYPAAVIRLMILDRPWARPWDYRPVLLDAAAARLAELHRAAGRGIKAAEAETAEVRRLLAQDLDVPSALDTAIDGTGGAARLLLTTLGLT
jgi:cysteinyl-tRNA synthetase